MPELRTAIDPTNPGQFYACCGLVELFNLRGAETLSHFEADPHVPKRAEFVLRSKRELDLTALLADLAAAQYAVLDHRDAAIAPVKAQIGSITIELDWWLDYYRQEKSEKGLKLWAGQVTPAKLFAELPGVLPREGNPMQFAALTKTKFGVDPRAAWEPINIGFSPNEHQGASVYPAVELLAAFGLQGFRPVTSRRDGAVYSAWLDPLPRMLCRVSGRIGGRSVHYRFDIEKRGSYRFFAFAAPMKEGSMA
ncbi:MAG: hypothetical protein LLG20_16955 [Acidobacteriales bacterium]|nr:hypothetical protein [Terriglobales bacterium]